MAVHRVGSIRYKQHRYDQSIWKNYGGVLAYMLRNPFPFTGKTTEQENWGMAWLYGQVHSKGPGKIRIIYPYVTDYLEEHELRNINYSYYPFVTLEARGKNFVGWRNGATGELISTEVALILSEGQFEDVTSFLAEFSEDERNLGITAD